MKKLKVRKHYKENGIDLIDIFEWLLKKYPPTIKELNKLKK